MFSDSKLGFGLMRLPKDENQKIRIEEVKRMVDAFMEKGFTYFDTAYAYPGSEAAMKEALVDRYPRESYTIADKLPAWEIKEEADVERIFNESLARAGVDYFDFYLIHSVQRDNFDVYEKNHCFEFVGRMKELGKIKHIGLSFHDDAQFLDEILIQHPEIEFVQLQLNYLDWESESVQSRKNYEVVRKHGLPIIVMEPIKGGALACLPDEVEAMFHEVDASRSIASWALRFIGSKEGVMTILSGMSNEEQMQDNLMTMKEFVPLNELESACVQKVTDKILSYPTIPCTGCAYCVKGCPMGIKIPNLFSAYNKSLTQGNPQVSRDYYAKYTQDAGKASACIACGQCEGVCPQHLSIIELLKNVSEKFDQQ